MSLPDPIFLTERCGKLALKNSMKSSLPDLKTPVLNADSHRVYRVHLSQESLRKIRFNAI